MGHIYASDENGKEVGLDFEILSIEDKQKTEKLIKTLTRPVYSDFISLDMILTNTVDYLTGEKTIDEASAEISEKLNLYLKE